MQMPQITLRPVRESDFSLVVAWLNNPEVWAATVVGECRPTATTDPDLRQWFSEKMVKNHFAFMIERPSDHQPIGTVGFKSVAKGEAEIEITIGDVHEWGKGYGRAALLELLKLGFGELGLTRIVAKVMKTNQRALAFYLRLGFVTAAHANVQSNLTEVFMDRSNYEMNLSAEVR